MPLFGVFGGVSGIIFWIDRYRDRARAGLILIKSDYDLGVEPDASIQYTLELENVGKTPTSFGRELEISGLKVSTRQETPLAPVSFSMEFDEEERTLEPFNPVRFNVHGAAPAYVLFMALQIIRLPLSKGPKATAYFRGAGNEQISASRYYWLFWRARLFRIDP